MKNIFFIFLFISTSLFSQTKDLLVIDGVRYKGKLIDYLDLDIRNPDSGYLTFYFPKINDTLRFDSKRNIKLKINKIQEFYDFEKKSWNSLEGGLIFSPYGSHGSLFISKGLLNENLLNIGLGSGIYNIDQIDFIPIFLSNTYDILPINRSVNYRVYLFNKIGFSFGNDFGSSDYITTDGGFFINPGIGIKRSFRKKHFSFNIGYMIQNYKSEHNFWRWDWWPIIGLPDDQSNNIIRRDGKFKVLTFTFSIYF